MSVVSIAAAAPIFIADEIAAMRIFGRRNEGTQWLERFPIRFNERCMFF
jgi:hypothetical protein